MSRQLLLLFVLPGPQYQSLPAVHWPKEMREQESAGWRENQFTSEQANPEAGSPTARRLQIRAKSQDMRVRGSGSYRDLISQR